MAAEPVTGSTGADQRRADRQYVEEVLDLLWPGHRRTEHPTRGGMVMLPAGRPRLVLPGGPGRVAAAALRNYNTAGAGVRRGRLAVGALALRFGAASLAPASLAGGLDSGPDGIDAELSEVLEREVFVGLYLGPPRAVQKPVLQVLDARGSTIAFAKVSMDGHTARLLEHEAAALRSLAARAAPRMLTPALLHEGRWRGHRLTVQQAIGRDHRRSVSAEVRTAAAHELFSEWGTSRAPLGTSACVRRVVERVPLLPDSPLGRQLREAVDVAVARTGDVDLRYGASHGDWTPWNMAVDGSRLAVWDWEGLATDVPLGFDELHWRVNHAVTIDRTAPARAIPAAAARMVEILRVQVGGRWPARVTTLWYVLDLATRYVADGEYARGGTPLSGLDDWVGPVVVPMLAGLARGQTR